MANKKLREVFEARFEVLGKVEDGKYSHHLLVQFHGSTALRLLSIDTTRKLDVQLGWDFGGLEQFLRQASKDASASDLLKLLRELYTQTGTVGQPPSKAVEAYNILSQLFDLQQKKEQTPYGSRSELESDYNRLSSRLRGVDEKSE